MCSSNCWHCIHNGGIIRVPLCCPVCPVRKVVKNCAMDEGMWQPRACFPEMTKSSTCKKLVLWYERSRNIIYELSRRLKRSQEFVQHLLLKLLLANYGEILNLKGPFDASYFIPLSEYPNEDRKDIFDSWGNLLDPLDPNNIVRILQILKNYVRSKTDDGSGTSSAANQFDRLAVILGPDDPLVKLLCKVNENIVCPFDLEEIFNVLDELVLEKELYEAHPHKKFDDFVKSIEDVYNSVVQGKVVKLEDVVQKNGSDDAVSMKSDGIDMKLLLTSEMELLAIEKLLYKNKRKPSKKQTPEIPYQYRMIHYPTRFNSDITFK